jgi:hypothetical protein
MKRRSLWRVSRPSLTRKARALSYNPTGRGNMDTTTLLIIILIVLILFGGGWYGRGRWF